MIYIVTGYMRSGTSMMMEALDAGGLPVARSAKRDRLIERDADEHYRMNESLWELTIPEMRDDPEFPARYDGYAVKLVFPWLQWMRPSMEQVSADPKLYAPNYKVCVMLRHPEEVRQSNNAALRRKSEKEIPAKYWPKIYGAFVRGNLLSFHKRPDVDTVTVLNFDKVLVNPARAFHSLVKDGWPIDVAKAQRVIKPSLARFTLDRLTVGI